MTIDRQRRLFSSALGLIVLVATPGRGAGAQAASSPPELDSFQRGVSPARLALDAIDLMNGLGREQFSLASQDWTANMAGTLAVGWPSPML